MAMTKAVKVIISGRVQGVFYRASTQQAANRLNIKGWVKNLPDGCVEAVFEADDKTIDQMVEWCRKGPANAAVSEVAIEPCPVENFISFDIEY